ncbi:MAG: class I SAM-dependent methyltransferase [Candidatus Magasanikbacteria bacterium]|jgi:ubiquinone/menaquinone biosynthesis C-methylase UbiE|nr:class I SAM-dependent methyltransferase [Candidatus Magasanikbacteria bacterium]MBT4221465.1 class I SAM-dependent methyltransferase [Candidatus Magasanikbacteria bacterium]MBT4350687.1 class I SAM-dependent methyltransferase [Candidatus Magasanikbacteria bacterium]MBT4541637.1 class I SAM-dependent methyltransferase [Candidatus Magasanikbacteria bacterium]MBT6252920.1 class I SAM-dependent methyltransferase [Candidatus Magasanikbacteria bacterium]
MKKKEIQSTLGWGVHSEGGAEIWDTNPLFPHATIKFTELLKLVFYPKKCVLYWFIYRAFKKKNRGVSKRVRLQEPFRILDVGCGTGATIVDLKKLFGRGVEVHGLDVVRLQLDIAKKKIKQYGVWPQVKWYDGVNMPYQKEYFDVVYASDVLGHVEDVSSWLAEIHRVLIPGGLSLMFSESKLGKHAFIRRYLFNRDCNIDPHKEFHISLYSKKKLKQLFSHAGFTITHMYSIFWAKFFAHPDEFQDAFSKEKRFFVLRIVSKVLLFIKKKLHPFSTAVVELYGLIEMLTIGRWIESQGYIIRAKKE